MQPEPRKRYVPTLLLLAALCVPPSVLALLPAALSASQSLADTGLHLNATRFDSLGRLVAYPGKETVPCPPQTERTAVLLVAGQSNAANHAQHRYSSAHGDHVIAFFGGQCAIAQSPLLGASGQWGELWTPLANRLIASGAYDRVVLVPAAIGGSSAEMWTRSGRLHPILAEAIAEAHANRYAFTHVLWYQGESDYFAQTSAAKYRSELTDIFDSIREDGVSAPIFIAVATRCNAIAPQWTRDNPIAHVQRTYRESDPSVHIGVDSDMLLSNSDRFDNCHLGPAGVDKVVASWTRILNQQHADR